MLEIYEATVRVTESQFNEAVESFRGLLDEYRTAMSLSPDTPIIPPVAFAPVEQIVYGNLEYTFITNKSKKDQRMASNRAKDEAREREDEQQRQEAEDIHNNKCTVGHDDYEYRYARCNHPDGYSSDGDQKDMQYWDIKNGTSTWVEHIDEVKARFPKS